MLANYTAYRPLALSAALEWFWAYEAVIGRLTTSTGSWQIGVAVACHETEWEGLVVG
jgi:hypothetical protein